METRLVDAEPTAEDRSLTRRVKPASWEEFVGQGHAVQTLRRALEAAERRKEPLDHVFLYGPPGLGKSTLADLITDGKGATTNGGMLARPMDAFVTVEYDVVQPEKRFLFIDEVHSARKGALEPLYQLLEAGSIIMGAWTRTECKEGITVIAATTRPVLVPAPFRDRFGIQIRLEYYTPQELSQVVARSALKLETELEDTLHEDIGRRSRGTPRLANRLLRRVRDFGDRINKDLAREAFHELGIDPYGLDRTDRQYLRLLRVRFRGGPAGARVLAETLGEEERTLTELIEPYLIREGFVKVEPRGRVLLRNPPEEP